MIVSDVGTTVSLRRFSAFVSEIGKDDQYSFGQRSLFFFCFHANRYIVSTPPGIQCPADMHVSTYHTLLVVIGNTVCYHLYLLYFPMLHPFCKSTQALSNYNNVWHDFLISKWSFIRKSIFFYKDNFPWNRTTPIKYHLFFLFLSFFLHKVVWALCF